MYFLYIGYSNWEFEKIADTRGDTILVPYVNSKVNMEISCPSGHITKLKGAKYRSEAYKCKKCTQGIYGESLLKDAEVEAEARSLKILNNPILKKDTIEVECLKCNNEQILKATLGYFIIHGKSCPSCKKKEMEARKEETRKRKLVRGSSNDNSFKNIYYNYKNIVRAKMSNRDAVFYSFEFTRHDQVYKEYGITVNWALRRRQYEREGLVLKNIEAIFTTLLEAYTLEQSLFNEPRLKRLKPSRNLGFVGWTECFNISQATQEEKNILNIF